MDNPFWKVFGQRERVRPLHTTDEGGGTLLTIDSPPLQRPPFLGPRRRIVRVGERNERSGLGAGRTGRVRQVLGRLVFGAWVRNPVNQPSQADSMLMQERVRPHQGT